MKLNIAFIGGGNMGRGMIGGLIGRGLPATHVTVADLNEAGLDALPQDPFAKLEGAAAVGVAGPLRPFEASGVAHLALVHHVAGRIGELGQEVHGKRRRLPQGSIRPPGHSD